VKLSLIDAVAAMLAPQPATDLYVNIGADGPDTTSSGREGDTRGSASPYHAPLDRFEAVLSPLAATLTAAVGELELAHVNLWLGAARAGSTSGLHSDPYDNVLLVLNGTKYSALVCVTVLFTSHCLLEDAHGSISHIETTQCVRVK
jgi:hypothetical protein